MTEKLPLIGRDRVLIENLAKAMHKVGRQIGDHTKLRESPRGNYFEVLLDSGRVARVTIELDRVDLDLKADPPAKP